MFFLVCCQGNISPLLSQPRWQICFRYLFNIIYPRPSKKRRHDPGRVAGSFSYHGIDGECTVIKYSKQQFLNSFHYFFFFSLFLSCFLLQYIFTIFGLGLGLGPGLWSFYTVREDIKYQNLIEQMTPVLGPDYMRRVGPATGPTR